MGVRYSEFERLTSVRRRHDRRLWSARDRQRDSRKPDRELSVNGKHTAPRANLRGAPHLISFFSKNRVNDCNLSYIDTFVCVP